MKVPRLDRRLAVRRRLPARPANRWDAQPLEYVTAQGAAARRADLGAERRQHQLPDSEQIT